MIDKCVNPACTTPFRYLRGGKLFLVSPAAPVDLSALGPLTSAARSSEYFWLCEHCCQFMFVTIEKSGEVVLVAGSERQPIMRSKPPRVERKRERKTEPAPLEPIVA